MPVLVPPPDLAARRLRRLRWREAVLAGGVVVLAHLVLLGSGLDGLRRRGDEAHPPTLGAVQVRQIVVVPPRGRLDAAGPLVVVQPAVEPPIEFAAPSPARAPTIAVSPAPPRAADERPRGRVEGARLAVAVAEAAATGMSVPPASATLVADGDPPPVYPTRIAPPFAQVYGLRRGALSGTAELVFRSGTGGAEGYELTLHGRVLGIDAIGLASRGAIDAAGLAPERFTDRRRGRDRLAANFDRVGGRITYSGPQVSYPLTAGAQDRLSWMVQLPAIVDAEPARWIAGGRIALFVSGARGDADVWAFQVHEREDIDLPGGRIAGALRLTRQPRQPYDTEVEIWLDPARHHLPVRARMTTLPGGDTLELTIEP